jgi:Holliday junction resolvasome RuvABC ATP-dependent DNA helicase subunit
MGQPGVVVRAAHEALVVRAGDSGAARGADRSRRRAFVGRRAEMELLLAALAGKPDSPAVVFLHGPAGIGKSTLVRLFADECRVAGRHVVHLDGGLLGSSPESFEAAAAGVAEGTVLVIDRFERCQRLET